MLRQWLGLGTILVGLLGCNSAEPAASSPASRSAADTVSAPRMLTNVSKQITVTNLRLQKSLTQPLTGDVRPMWIVSGSLQNHTTGFVSSVWLEFHVRDKQTGQETDSTVLKLNDLRLPPNEGVQAFSRTVQLLPPKTSWSWDYEVIHGEGDVASAKFDWEKYPLVSR